MRLAAAFTLHEWRTQTRSLRFRVLAALYVAAGATPAVAIWLRRPQWDRALGGATFAAETLEVLPCLTAVLAFLISLDAITREQEEGAWSTVALAGMSSAGYLLRRWLALQALLLPLTALPLLAAAALAGVASGPAAVTAGPFLGPWLMHVAPLAMTSSALALGAGTIAGGTLNAFLLGGFALLLLPAVVNSLLSRFGIVIADGLRSWLAFDTLSRSFRRLAGLRGQDYGWMPSFPLAVSEAPYDAVVDGEWFLNAAAVPVAQAALFLGLAVRYLRRTRPDVRPWRIPPEHPLRTFLGVVSRLRERYTPDPAPARKDLAVLGLALLLAAGASALTLGRERHYEAMGRARFAAERAQETPATPTDLVPGRWRVEGRIGADRNVALTVTGEMRNAGSAPRGHLAFELNPELRIAGATADAGTLALARSWNRLLVDLDPPIPPGGRRELRFRLAGKPSQFTLSSGFNTYGSFYRRFSDYLHARFGRDLLDLSASYRVPAISPRRVELAATDLSPVPRYQAWKLDESLLVVDETFHPQADLDLSLAVPSDLFLADACGNVAASGRLGGRCSLPLDEIAVLGGRYRTLPARGSGTTVAVYPPHAALGELHLGFVGRGASELEEAWPGLGGLQRTVALEWPGEAAFDRDPIGTAWANLWREGYDVPLTVRGNLILIDESNVIRDSALLKPETFVASLVASRLSHRRPMAADDSLFFRKLFQDLAMQRLGLGPSAGATVAGLRPGTSGLVRVPLPKEYGSSLYWDNRFPALVTALRHQMGEEAMRQAVEEVLARRDERPATRQEMFAALERHGGPDLHRFLQENLVAGGLAEPVLDGVAFSPAGDGWRVTGRMVNHGDARAVCKIVLTTDLGPVETVARADAGQAGAFELRANRRPQAVLLDPDQECHRLIPNGAPSLRVFFQGGPR